MNVYLVNKVRGRQEIKRHAGRNIDFGFTDNKTEPLNPFYACINASIHFISYTISRQDYNFVTPNVPSCDLICSERQREP